MKLIGSTLLPYVVCKRSTEVYLGTRTKGEWNITALYEDFVLALITKASPALIPLNNIPQHAVARGHYSAPILVPSSKPGTHAFA